MSYLRQQRGPPLAVDAGEPVGALAHEQLGLPQALAAVLAWRPHLKNLKDC